MGGLWTAYMDSSDSTRSSVLQDIIKATPTLISQDDRKGLVQNILDDIEASTISKDDLPSAILAVKTLARLPEGSAIVVKQSNLRLLRTLCANSQPPSVASEALRCVANALLLVESGRDAWIQVDGGKLCLQYLMDPKTNEEFCFLNARILFLSTLKQCEFLKDVVEDEKNLDVIVERCEALLDANLAARPFAKDALTDVLKFMFNLLLQYPRMVENQPGEKKLMGEQWNERFEPLVPPLIHLFTRLPSSKPPLTSPLTHVIHALLNVPVVPYSSVFFPSASPSSSTAPSTKSKSSFSNGLSGLAGGITDPFQRAMSLLSSQRRSFQRPDTPKRSTSSTSGTASPRRSESADETLDTKNGKGRARSSSPSKSLPIASKFQTVKDAKAGSAKSETPSSKPSTPKSESFKPSKSDNKSSHRESTSISNGGGKKDYLIITHACQLLDTTLANYWPGSTEVDSSSTRSSAITQGINLDETITPLVVLIARMAEDPTARVQMRDWILPADLDRTAPLEGRADTLGRCIRLLSSVYYSRLKDAVGEWLFALCDNDASLLSSQIGYGNAAGYLFNKGILSAPPPPPSSSTASTSASGASTSVDGRDINPITGVINRDVEDDGPEMTEEEKEREAERLFVLFDRLEKSGMVQNPVRKAIQEGKLSMGPFGP